MGGPLHGGYSNDLRSFLASCDEALGNALAGIGALEEITERIEVEGQVLDDGTRGIGGKGGSKQAGLGIMGTIGLDAIAEAELCGVAARVLGERLLTGRAGRRFLDLGKMADAIIDIARLKPRGIGQLKRAPGLGRPGCQQRRTIPEGVSIFSN
jgi:hypothetical protein